MSAVDASAVDLAQYRPYFRELDIEVFNILGCGLVSRTVLDSEMQSKVRPGQVLGTGFLLKVLPSITKGASTLE